MSQPHLAIKTYFRKLKDPRLNRRKRHLLLDIITITICAVVAGAADWQQIVTFANVRQDWLKRFLPLPNGIPSHDTFERVFDCIHPQAFQACFRQWMQALHESLGLCQIAIDGKTLRGSGGGGKRALHMVSAWATANQVSLGQVAVDDKSNEITAIPQLLELLDVKGALVSIDAMGCQKEIAADIVARGGDFVLTVKDNQPNLLTNIQECLQEALDNNFRGVQHDEYKTRDRGHGRQEARHYTILTDPPGFSQKELWPNVCVIGMCVSERIVGNKRSDEVRYFIGSRKADAKTYGQALRNHWSIENHLHWQLDVCFGEDKNRFRRRHGAENLCAARRLALVLLKQHSDKSSLPCKRLRAALDPAFLQEVLTGGESSAEV
jgi:predicted transposase YbfD/YdcC